MTQRRRLALAVALCASFLAPLLALGDNTRVVLTNGSRITHGHFAILSDGGFSWDVCGDAPQNDGGTTRALDAPCIYGCESGAFNNAPTVCRAAWRAANGLCTPATCP